MINRAAIILKYKPKAVRWINAADPFVEDPKITLKEVNEERTVYLISDKDAEAPENVEQWLKWNYENIFESELESWYTDEKLWPENRTYRLFMEWFSIECHTVIEDTVGTPIADEET